MKIKAIQYGMFDGFGEGPARGGTIRDESALGGLFDRTDEAPRPEPVLAIDAELPFGEIAADIKRAAAIKEAEAMINAMWTNAVRATRG